MSAQFFGRSGKVLYGAFSIVGMAYQSQNVNNGMPDDRVARSIFTGTFETTLFGAKYVGYTTQRFLIKDFKKFSKIIS